MSWYTVQPGPSMKPPPSPASAMAFRTSASTSPGEPVRSVEDLFNPPQMANLLPYILLASSSHVYSWASQLMQSTGYLLNQPPPARAPPADPKEYTRRTRGHARLGKVYGRLRDGLQPLLQRVRAALHVLNNPLGRPDAVHGLDERARDRVDERHCAEVPRQHLVAPHVLPKLLPGVQNPQFSPVPGLFYYRRDGGRLLLVVLELEDAPPLHGHEPVVGRHL